MQEETTPISELIRTLAPETQRGMAACVRVLNSMTWDYHDYKGLPEMTLGQHLGSGFNSDEADFVREHMKEARYRGSELIGAGVPKWLLRELGVIARNGEVDEGRLVRAAAEVECAGHRFACFIPDLYMVDLMNPRTVYRA
jgi:hypothetical protein